MIANFMFYEYKGPGACFRIADAAAMRSCPCHTQTAATKRTVTRLCLLMEGEDAISPSMCLKLSANPIIFRYTPIILQRNPVLIQYSCVFFNQSAHEANDQRHAMQVMSWL